LLAGEETFVYYGNDGGKMILANIRMKVSPQKRGEVLRILRSTAEGNRILPGCLSCRIYEDLQEVNVIMFEELWRSKEELEQHLRSDDYRKILLLMEMALQHPEVRFNNVSSSSGMETIEKARIPAGRGNWP
jgi:quinol monooxygenase YgiN